MSRVVIYDPIKQERMLKKYINITLQNSKEVSRLRFAQAAIKNK